MSVLRTISDQSICRPEFFKLNSSTHLSKIVNHLRNNRPNQTIKDKLKKRNKNYLLSIQRHELRPCTLVMGFQKISCKMLVGVKAHGFCSIKPEASAQFMLKRSLYVPRDKVQKLMASVDVGIADFGQFDSSSS